MKSTTPQTCSWSESQPCQAGLQQRHATGGLKSLETSLVDPAELARSYVEVDGGSVGETAGLQGLDTADIVDKNTESMSLVGDLSEVESLEQTDYAKLGSTERAGCSHGQTDKTGKTECSHGHEVPSSTIQSLVHNQTTPPNIVKEEEQFSVAYKATPSTSALLLYNSAPECLATRSALQVDSGPAFNSPSSHKQGSLEGQLDSKSRALETQQVGSIDICKRQGPLYPKDHTEREKGGAAIDVSDCPASFTCAQKLEEAELSPGHAARVEDNSL